MSFMAILLMLFFADIYFQKQGNYCIINTAAITGPFGGLLGVAVRWKDMKKRLWNKWIKGSMVIALTVLVLSVFLPMSVCARKSRTVRVAFFPMEGFHTYSEETGYGGMDVAYLDEVCVYTGWDIEYVDCESWDDALDKLKAQEVDLVGSAQYSPQRAEIYDYAALPSGYTYGCLFVGQESDLAFEDFARMKSMEFGVVSSYIRKGEFLEYLERNGIDRPSLHEYESTQHLQEALTAGEIDVAVHTLTEVWEGQCLVGKFAYAPYYYISWKGNATLLDELNRGIEEINMDGPTLEQELINRYYGDRRENFAADELELINSGESVRIGFYKDTRPLAYMDEQGEYVGIYLQILRIVSERSGIPMEFCPLERDVYWKDLLMNGEIDFYVGANSMQLAQNEDVILTNEFMAYNSVIISRIGYALTPGEVKMVLTKGRAYWAEHLDTVEEIIYCDNSKECLLAVAKGEADITLLNTIEYNYQSKNERFSDLMEWENYRYQSGCALAAAKDVNPVLFDVMNKSMRLVTSAEKEEIVNQYMNIPYDTYELPDYLYQSKEVILIAVIILAFVISFGIVIFRMRRKSYHMLEKKNDELQLAIRDAKKANRAKTEFLSHMSHDMRTPINGIMGMLNIAEKNPEDLERQEDCRKKIKTSAEHLLSLINDVLDINNLESDHMELANEMFSIHELLSNCMVMIGGQAATRNIKLTTDFTVQGGLPHEYFMGSPLHIKQVLVSIAGNAVKYNKPSGSVDIKCHELSAEDGIARVCFEVSDTGVGMSQEFLGHIFEPFTQEMGGARTNYQGTGLGMTITKKLVDSMDGTIQVESEVGQGTVCTVVLPLEIVAVSGGQEVDADAETDGISGKHALIVEDNELNREIAQYMIEENGLEVTMAENGQEAVELFQQSAPYTYQIVFMDIMMPVMDGHEATRVIRSLDRPDASRIPIIAMTANAFAEDVQAAKDAGMNEHMAKPLEPEIISEVLKRWLGNK